MNEFKITKELILKAKSYMPLEEKIAYSTSIAENCLRDYKTADQNRVGEKFLALPYLKGEDMGLKSVLLMNVLLGFYFDIELKTSDNSDDVYKEYNKYASGNILNQIERFKSDVEIKDKVFDLIADYKDFKKMVDTEIYNLKALNNDPIARLSASIQILSTPENIKLLSEELKKVTEEYENKLDEKKNNAKEIERKEEEKVNV